MDDTSNQVQEKKFLHFNNKMYTDAFKNKWLPQLATWLLVFNKYTSKAIHYKENNKTERLLALSKELGMSKATLYAHFKFLAAKGLISTRKGQISLASTKQIQKIYPHSSDKLFVDKEKLTCLTDTLLFLKTIPVLSNLQDQFRFLQKIENLNTIIQSPDSTGQEKYKASKALKRVKKNRTYDYFDPDLNLSIFGVARIAGRRSSTTGVKYKKALKRMGIAHNFQRSLVTHEYMSKCDFEFNKKYGNIPDHFLRTKDGKVFTYLTNIFVLPHLERKCIDSYEYRHFWSIKFVFNTRYRSYIEHKNLIKKTLEQVDYSNIDCSNADIGPEPFFPLDCISAEH